MIVELVKNWKRNRIGAVFTDMPDGVGELLISRGIGVKIDGNDKPIRSGDTANERTSDDTGSQEATRNSKQRHRSR